MASGDKLETAPSDPADLPLARRHRAMRRAFLAFLAIVVLIGATGWLGVKTATATAEGEGYTLTVTYASISRPGLATPFAISVESESGFDSPFSLKTSSRYLEIFDENGLDPDPPRTDADGTWSIWGFDKPASNTLQVSFDARIAPAVQWGVDGQTQLLIGDRVITSVAYRTWVMP